MGRMTTRRVRALKSALLACAAFAAPAICVAATPAIAQSQAQPQYDFNLPAQPLARSIAAVAARADIQVLYTEDAPNEVRASALRGQMTAEQALARLTAGTGFTYVYTQPGVIRLERVRNVAVEDDGSRMLGPVRVEGAQSSFAYSGGPTRGDGIAQLGGVRGGQDEEATGYRAHVATVGGLSPVAIEDIPRSISVLTQEQIEKQDIQDIGDALRRLPGVAVIEESNAGFSTGAGVFSRGFQISKVQLDGGASRPLNILGNGLLDLGSYERVELVRGPNGVFSGANSPGGSLNLVRKRPGDIESSEITATLGSFNRRSVQVDYSTPSLGGSPFAFRGVASASDQQFQYDKSSRTNALLYGIVDAPLGAKARMELGAQYSLVDDNAPYAGLYRYTGGELIQLGDYYLNLTPAYTYERNETTGAFARLYVDIADQMDLQVGVDLESGRQSRLRFNAGLNFVEETGQSILSYSSIYTEEVESSNLSFDFKLTGRNRFLGLDHAWFVAGELTDTSALPVESLYNLGNNPSFASINDLLQFLEAPPPPLGNSAVVDAAGGGTTRAGLVIGDVISWRDKVELSLSARRYFSDNSSFFVSGYEGYVTDISFSEGANGSSRAAAEWVPSWSLAFKPTRNLTLYGTLAEGREEVPNPRFTATGETVGPSTYENLEGGIKFAADRWLATLAYYDMKNDNVAQPMWGTSCPPTNTQNTPCYLSEGATVQSTGVDFELAGEVIPGLSVSANYTWSKIESTATGDNASSQTPVHAGQIFVDWTPAAMPETSFRAGVRYRGKVFQEGTRRIYDPQTGDLVAEPPYTFTEDAYLVFDAGVRRRLTPNLSLDVFVENLTDEQYLSTISATAGNFPGAPRSIVATLRWSPTDLDFPQSTTGMAPFGDPADWYAAVETGLFSSDDLTPKAEGVSQDGVTPVNWTFETHYRSIGLVRLGYRFSNHWRGELEGSFRNAVFGDIGGGSVAPFGVCGASYSDYRAPFDCDKADGDMASWTGMLNGLYDFGAEGSRIRPFVGIGVGVSRNSIDFAGKMEGIGQDTPWRYDARRHIEEGIGGDTTRTAFTYQLVGGLSYRLNSQATIEATYRYYAVPALSWGSYNLEGVGGFPQYGDPWPALTGRVGDFETDFRAHTLTVGLRWAFGVK